MGTIPVSEKPLRLTFEEFLAWGDGIRAEWVDGEVEIMRPVSAEHQDLGGFLFPLFRLFVEERQLGKVFDQTFLMKLGAVRAGREPDIMFVANARLSLVRNSFIDGPADLAVEIVSPESTQRDRETKLAEYERGGVREFWLVDPLVRGTRFYQLQADGTYRIVPPDANGVYRSVVLEGLWINVNWLWQRPLPSVMSVLREWGLV